MGDFSFTLLGTRRYWSFCDFIEGAGDFPGLSLHFCFGLLLPVGFSCLELLLSLSLDCFDFVDLVRFNEFFSELLSEAKPFRTLPRDDRLLLVEPVLVEGRLGIDVWFLLDWKLLSGSEVVVLITCSLVAVVGT